VCQLNFRRCVGYGGVEINLDPPLIELLKKSRPQIQVGLRRNASAGFERFAMNVSQIHDHDSPIELEIKVVKEMTN
jgi:hypothetical protein